MEFQMSTIILALIAMSSAPLLAWLTSLNSRREKAADAGLRAKEKAEDYRRQDLVAARAEAVAARAELVASKVDASAAAIREANQRVVKQSEANGGKLDQIHILVNSAFSAAVQSELNAFIALLALMMKDPGGNAVEIMETKKKIATLSVTIAERERQSALVNTQINTQAMNAAHESAADTKAPAAPVAAPAAPAPAPPADEIAAAKAAIAAADAKVKAQQTKSTPAAPPLGDSGPVTLKVVEGALTVENDGGSS